MLCTMPGRSGPAVVTTYEVTPEKGGEEAEVEEEGAEPGREAEEGEDDDCLSCVPLAKNRAEVCKEEEEKVPNLATASDGHRPACLRCAGASVRSPQDGTLVATERWERRKRSTARRDMLTAVTLTAVYTR